MTTELREQREQLAAWRDLGAEGAAIEPQKKSMVSRKIEKIAEEMWDALDKASEDSHIAIRGDDAVVKKSFRRSWNTPDGVRTTRLPGVCAVYVGYDFITLEDLTTAIERAYSYGKNLYLLEGDSPTDMQDVYGNDPGERLLTSHKILYRHIWGGE